MNKYLYISNLLEFINVNKEFFLKTVAPSPQNLRYFISEDAPKRICAAFKQPSEIVPIKGITADLQINSDYKVLFVEFDPSFVSNITDCYAIAIAISPTNEIRLFTYEHGVSRMTNEVVYYTGEFKADHTNANYGAQSRYGMELFSGVIMSVLNPKAS